MNAVCPGYIDTPMLPHIDALRDKFVAAAPMKRLGRPEEIGERRALPAQHRCELRDRPADRRRRRPGHRRLCRDRPCRSRRRSSRCPPTTTRSARPSPTRTSPRCSPPWRRSPAISHSCAPTPTRGVHSRERMAGCFDSGRRARAPGRAAAIPRRRRLRGAGARARRPAPDDGVHGRRARSATSTCRCSTPSSPSPTTTPARPTGARTTSRRHRLPGRHHRRGDVGDRGGAPAAAGRRPFVIFEKNDDVGGTWLENTLSRAAGSTCPTTSTATRSPSATTGPSFFSARRRCCSTTSATAPTEFGLREHIRFGTEVRRAEFDDDTASWTLRAAHGATAAEVARGRRGHQRASASSTGRKLPDIAGRDAFAGPAFHSAAVGSRPSTSRGKRVAVIGTGASGIQFIPEIADEAAELRRVPAHAELVHARARVPRRRSPTGCSGCSNTSPHYCQWYRFWLFWRMAEGAARRRPGRSGPAADGTVGQRRQRRAARLADRATSRRSSPTRPSCSTTWCPPYPPLAKRMLLDNGTLGGDAQPRQRAPRHRDDRPDHATRHRHRPTATEHEVDVIIYATGFQASRVPDADAGHRARRRRPARAAGTATPAPTSASPCPASPTCSASTGPTPTSWRTAASSSSPSARSATCSSASGSLLERRPRGARLPARRVTTRTTCAIDEGNRQHGVGRVAR